MTNFPVTATDTGVSVSDSIAASVLRMLSATGLTVSVAAPLRLVGRAQPTTTGLTISDTLRRSYPVTAIDTGVTVIGDAITAGPIRVRLPIDALVFSDFLGKTVSKQISVTGLTISDTLRRSYPVTAADTGVSISDSLVSGRRRVLTDTALSLTFGFSVQVNGHNAQIQTTDRGVTVTDSAVSTRAFFRAVPTYLPDTGLNISSGIRITRVPPSHPTKPQADFTWTVSGQTVTFTDTSTPGSAPIGSWDWGFGDGSTSSAQNPIHTYSSPGTYVVTLTVTTVYGTSTVSHPVETSSVSPTPGYHIDAVVV